MSEPVMPEPVGTAIYLQPQFGPEKGPYIYYTIEPEPEP